MSDWLSLLAPYAVFGGGAGAGFVFLKWLLEWISGRMDKNRDAIDAGTQRLIEGLEHRLEAVTKRLDKVENDLAECKLKHAESEAQVMKLRAQLQGYGDARQHAQRIIAEEKKGADR